MTSFVNLHAIHSLPASNLNRGKNGDVKTIVYGGATRTRLSSQSLKRAMRTYLRARLADDRSITWGTRTVTLPALVTQELVGRGRNGDAAAERIYILLKAKPLTLHFRQIVSDTGEDASAGDTADDTKAGKKKVDDPSTTATALFISDATPSLLADVVEDYWDQLTPGSTGFDSQFTIRVRAAFKADKAVDVAVFGRMIAELPGNNVDAALSVAHAFSVGSAAVSDDFFTALDDRIIDERVQASMMGFIPLTAPIVYRYASLDTGQLSANLSGDAGLSGRATEGVIEAFIRALPTGHRTGTAPETLPSFVLATVSDRSTSLADAFTAPLSGPDMYTEARSLLLTHAAQVAKFTHPKGMAVLPVADSADTLRAILPEGLLDRAPFSVVSDDTDSAERTFEAFVKALL